MSYIRPIRTRMYIYMGKKALDISCYKIFVVHTFHNEILAAVLQVIRKNVRTFNLFLTTEYGVIIFPIPN